jgi:hypothetical protein
MPVSIIKALVRHLSVGLLGFTTMAAPWGAPQAQEPGATSRFYVTFRGVRIGSETVTVTRGDGADHDFGPRPNRRADQSGHNQVRDGLQHGLAAAKADDRGRAPKPDADARDVVRRLTTAISDVIQGTTRGSTSHDVSPRTVVLPPSFFAAYEVLAARLPSFQIGARFPVFIAPEGEIGGVLTKVTPRRIVNPNGTTELREYSVTLDRPGCR